MIVRQLRSYAVVGQLAIAATLASAHWLSPGDIVAGIANDPQLSRSVGVTGARNDPKLPRLLIISVARATWDAAPAADRTRLAEEWWETWRHSVPDGIVAVLDAATDESLVNFDGVGRARLKAPRARTPAP